MASFVSSTELAIIGGGPAGLRAAEVAALGGASVTVFDAKPSVGRKFLVAGRGGLNLSCVLSAADFAARYSGEGEPLGVWLRLLGEFDTPALRQWASSLGVDTFEGTSGRIYPVGMKAAPLLRRWVQRLRALGVQFALGHRWTSIERNQGWRLGFRADGEERQVESKALILALGGGSWPETGSDGAWVAVLRGMGVGVTDLVSANCGWEVAWSAEFLARAEGKPLKNVVVRAGESAVTGELMITRYGVEGGALYQLGAALRRMEQPELVIDFKPSHTVASLVKKLGNCGSHFGSVAQANWRLSDAAMAVIEHAQAHELRAESGPEGLGAVSLVGPRTAEGLARTVKACGVRLVGPRRIDEAISSAGGVQWAELDQALMVERLPGVFVAGEMMDWEAPTGGFLMQGCFATGSRAGRGALEWLRAHLKS